MRGELVCVAIAVTSGVAAPCARAGGDDVQIVSRDGEAWSALIDAIEHDPSTAGQSLELVVIAGGDHVPCGGYQLALDDVGARAFTIGACDRSTGATTVTVTSRDALFEPGDPVPRARVATIHASITRRGQAAGGGAAPAAGAELWCTVALAPYLWDGLHGRPVPLTPDRYRVRAIDQDIDVVSDGDGWIARGDTEVALTFRYEVADVRTGEVVLTDTATLACADHASGDAKAPAPAVRAADDGVRSAQEVIDGLDAMLFSNAAMLMRNLDGMQLDDGRPASALGHSSRGLYYGTTLGLSIRWRSLYIPIRFGAYYDPHAGVVTFSGGVGWIGNLGRNVVVYGAPSVRVTTMGFSDDGGGDLGMTASADLALVTGLHWRLGARSHRWFSFEAAAPIDSSREWQFLAGISFANGDVH